MVTERRETSAIPPVTRHGPPAGPPSRGPPPPHALSIAPAGRPHRPAVVVAGHRQVGHRPVHPPVLAEPIRPPRFPRVVVAAVSMNSPGSMLRTNRPGRKRYSVPNLLRVRAGRSAAHRTPGR